MDVTYRNIYGTTYRYRTYEMTRGWKRGDLLDIQGVIAIFLSFTAVDREMVRSRATWMGSGNYITLIDGTGKRTMYINDHIMDAIKVISKYDEAA